ncbi:MAG: RimK family alpha-L-glutamate ligase [Gemmataceae bacterium]
MERFLHSDHSREVDKRDGDSERLSSSDCCILNNGPGAWAFEELARSLSSALWVDISATPRRYNYLLNLEDHPIPSRGELFIPYSSIILAADKRLLAERFFYHQVPIPRTWLVETVEEIDAIRKLNREVELCLKYPIGCGGSGHRLLTNDLTIPKRWPRPLLIQEFIRLERPEVYRTFGIGGEIFGWVARRYRLEQIEIAPSPWVAHARGAVYELEHGPPSQVALTAKRALQATDLLASFGCVDLLQRPDGEWVVLEVGTDGVFNHVDRDIGVPEFERELHSRLATAFWSRTATPPWHPGDWSSRSINSETTDIYD